MDIAEFILKMFTIGFFIAGILGMILQSVSFHGVVLANDNTRLSIDFANAAAAAPCLAQTISGDIRKGIMDFEKFEAAQKNFCLSITKPYKLKILESGKEIFTAGNLISPSQSFTAFPILIKRGENYTNGIIKAEVG